MYSPSPSLPAQKRLSPQTLHGPLGRKKRKKEEEHEFQLPPFDEKDYMRREVEGAKAALVTIAYAFTVALASYGLTLVGLASVGGLVGILSLYGLKYIYTPFRLDVTKFDKKAWAGNGAIHLFTWIAFWILLLNPPIVDVSPPVLHEATVAVPGMDTLAVASGESVRLPADAESITIRVRVTDNVGLDRVEIEVGQARQEMSPGQEANWWVHVLPPQPGVPVYEVRITAFDHQGLASQVYRMTLSLG